MDRRHESCTAVPTCNEPFLGERKKKEGTFPDLLGYSVVVSASSHHQTPNAKTKRQTTLQGLHLPIAIHDRYDTTRPLGLCRIGTHLHLTSLRRTRDRGRPCYAATVLPYSSGPGSQVRFSYDTQYPRIRTERPPLLVSFTSSSHLRTSYLLPEPG